MPQNNPSPTAAASRPGVCVCSENKWRKIVRTRWRAAGGAVRRGPTPGAATPACRTPALKAASEPAKSAACPARDESATTSKSAPGNRRDRLRQQRNARPRRHHHHLQFVGVTLRLHAQTLQRLERITPVAALRVGQRHAGFQPKPESGERIVKNGAATALLPSSSRARR